MDFSLGVEGNWIGIHDADPRAVALYERHYSANTKKNHRNGFIGPSERMVLITKRGDALFAWRVSVTPEEIDERGVYDKRKMARRAKGLFRHSSYFGGQSGIMCSVFRNEGPLRSSDLILEAEELAWQRWPGQRLFTYVWDERVKSVNPGYCFKMAGWTTAGRNKDGRLTILEKLPTAERQED